jgi:hypothetical protein
MNFPPLLNTRIRQNAGMENHSGSWHGKRRRSRRKPSPGPRVLRCALVGGSLLFLLPCYHGKK